MATATLTTKGQLTIPKNIRDALRLHTGDKIEIIVMKEGEAIIRPIAKKVDDVFCRLKRPDQKVATLEDMDRAIRKRMRNKFK
jgi:AbrB family looped-hinge helix DNA binding protein